MPEDTFPAHFCDQTHKTPIEDHVHASAPSKERNRSKSLGPFGQPAYFTNEGLVSPKFTILYSDGPHVHCSQSLCENGAGGGRGESDF